MLTQPRMSVKGNLRRRRLPIPKDRPEDAEAGVRVGDAEYRAYSGAAVGLTDPALRVAFFDRLSERLKALPGVQAAVATMGLPLGGTTEASM